MHAPPPVSEDILPPPRQRIRARTLILLRWVAVAGQLATIVVALAWGFRIPLTGALLAIGASVAMNVWLLAAKPSVEARGAALQLGFDLAQLVTLVALTGGLSNPFAVLVLAPAVIAATTMEAPLVATLTALTVLAVSMLGVISVPLVQHDGVTLAMPAMLEAAHGLAIGVAVVFVATYAYRVAQELRATGSALAATQLALAREQRLQHLGGVVAAAAHEMGTPLATIKLVASELSDELADRPEVAEDLLLLRDSADRCRDILRSMGRAGRDDIFTRAAPISALLEEAAEPHRARGPIEIALQGPAPEPVVLRDPGVIHALRNLIQNAVDFAASRTTVTADWTPATLTVRVSDDGPGYPADIIGRIGEPFLTARRDPRPGYESMGLGLFIARSLLARSGARVRFVNAPSGGAEATIVWPRARIEASARAPMPENPLILA